MKQIGPTQRAVLDAMCRRHGGVWSENAGWIWDTVSRTRRIMESLARAGLVRVTEERREGKHNTIVLKTYTAVDGQGANDK